MRPIAITLLLLSATLFAQPTDEAAVIAVVQKVFDGMAAHDAAMIRSTMLPDARFYSVRDAGKPSTMTAEDFATRIGGMQGALVERFTSKPKVDVQGRIAYIWAEYDFVRDGKFSHCGIDTATLFKTDDGWKIATLVYTAQTTGCRGR
jgi:hypothetical protein